MTVKSILISQNTPRVLTPYQAVTEKYGVEFEFRPFFLIEPLTSREFRAQRINILDYTAIVFSSRHAIDAFFTLAEELRCKIPETMKYFCTTEVVAMYLQKHIVYRKRKIFYGTGTPDSVVALIGPKHKGEKFLIATSDNSNNDTLYRLFEAAKLDYTPAVFVKSVSQDLKDVDLHAYDMIVLYNPADVKSLYENFPAFEQGDIKFVSYGRSIVKAMEEAGLSIEVKAPSPEVPSVARAIERYLEQQLVSVPKRHFKRAVKRNLLKRRIRESYRLQKEILPVPVDIAFLYQDRAVLPFSDIYTAMTAVLSAVAAKTE